MNTKDKILKGCGKRLADKDTWCGINEYWYCPTCQAKLQVCNDLEAEWKKKIEKLKSKDFIMSILKEEVTIDENERMKFIYVEGVRNKIDKIFGTSEEGEGKE